MDERCHVEHVDLDGDAQPVLVHGGGKLSNADRAALADLVHATRRHLAEHDPHLGLRQSLTRAVRDALRCIPDGPIGAGPRQRDGATVKNALRQARDAALSALSPSPHPPEPTEG